VWEDKVYLTQPLNETNERTIICFSLKDGKQIWQKGVQFAKEESTHRTNHYCSPSPVTDGERVIVWFGSAGLFCYDMDGNELWRRDLGPIEHMWGYGTSPILHGEICILNFGPGNREMLLGLDRRTGKDIWKVDPIGLENETRLSGSENDGNAKSKADDPPSKMLRGSWGTPVLTEEGTLVVNHPRRISGYDVNSGKLIWTCGGFGPLAYSSPIISSDNIVVLGGYFGGSLGLKPGGSGDITNTHRLWHKPRDGSWLGTGVEVDGHIYVSDMNGIFYCIDAKTGDEKWKKRLSVADGKGTTWGSATLTGDGLIYQLMQNGDTFIIRPSVDGFDQVARNTLAESSNSTIVVSGGKILIRTFETLWCIAK
jgi:outer membrane protein assembly factor BamB